MRRQSGDEGKPEEFDHRTWADAPRGSESIAMIGSGITLSGTGNAANLILQGNSATLGELTAGLLVVGGDPNLNSSLSGAWTINAGQTVSETGVVTSGDIIDNGVVSTGGNLTLGQPFVYAGGHGASSFAGSEFIGSLSGAGTIEAQTEATVTLQEPVTTPGLTFQLDGDANLTIEASIAAGNIIALNGTADVVTMNGQWYLQEHPATPPEKFPFWTGGLPHVDATITGFNKTDALIVVDAFQLNDSITSVGFKDGILSLMDGTSIESTFGLSGDYFGYNFTLSPVSGVEAQQAVTIEVACFVAGTRIATPGGAILVEQLAVGDVVQTISGQFRAIMWIGAGRGRPTRGRRGAATPVIVCKGALAPNVPNQDLRVTKGHSLYLDGVLIPAEFLVNHRSILWDDRAQEVSLYHIELETHDVLCANGAPAETYRDDGNRWLFQNATSGWYRAPKPPYAPVLTGGAIVDAVWRRLLDRAGPRPFVPLTDDPDIHLLVDGVRVDAAVRTSNMFVFALTRSPREVRVKSRASVPQELGFARDARCLGVAVQRVIIRQATRFKVLKASDNLLIQGFHAFEINGGLRWTDGDAILPVEVFADFFGPIEVVIQVGGRTFYIEDDCIRDVA